jgi:hypothetical protein
MVSPDLRTFKEAEPVTLPRTFPVNDAVIVPAEKLPEESLTTKLLGVLVDTAGVSIGAALEPEILALTVLLAILASIALITALLAMVVVMVPPAAEPVTFPIKVITGS